MSWREKMLIRQSMLDEIGFGLFIDCCFKTPAGMLLSARQVQRRLLLGRWWFTKITTVGCRHMVVLSTGGVSAYIYCQNQTSRISWHVWYISDISLFLFMKLIKIKYHSKVEERIRAVILQYLIRMCQSHISAGYQWQFLIYVFHEIILRPKQKYRIKEEKKCNEDA